MNKVLEKALRSNENSIWNEWRIQNIANIIQLHNFNFSAYKIKSLFNYNFNKVTFKHCSFENVSFNKCSFNSSTFVTSIVKSKFEYCSFEKSKFENCIISEINYQNSTFVKSHFTNSNFSKLNLFGTSFINCTFVGGSISDCSVFGTNIWLSKFINTTQNNLFIDSYNESIIKNNPLSVDDIEVANFIYLISNNEKLRNILNATTSKMILILGRFSDKEKKVLDQIKLHLKLKGLLPVIFDFENSHNKDLTGTVETLARMSSMVIADLTNPSSSPHELATIVPHLRTTAVALIRKSNTGGYGMFKDLLSYPWVIFKNYNNLNINNIIDNLLKRGYEINMKLRKLTSK